MNEYHFFHCCIAKNEEYNFTRFKLILNQNSKYSKYWEWLAIMQTTKMEAKWSAQKWTEGESGGEKKWLLFFFPTHADKGNVINVNIFFYNKFAFIEYALRLT